MSGRFRFVLSAACALLGVVSCLAYADTVRSEAERVRSDALERFGGEVARLAVADSALEAGDIVSETNVSMRDWLADLAPEDAIQDLDEVVGRELSVPVAKGAPLTELNFRDSVALSEVPAGHVAVSVPVNDKLGLARGVTRGAHVSAYVVDDGKARLIATDVEVLSELGSGQGIITIQQITIAVLPDNVTEVLAASAAGTLRLVIPAHDVKPTNQKEEQAQQSAPPKALEPDQEHRAEDDAPEGEMPTEAEPEETTEASSDAVPSEDQAAPEEHQDSLEGDSDAPEAASEEEQRSAGEEPAMEGGEQ